MSESCIMIHEQSSSAPPLLLNLYVLGITNTVHVEGGRKMRKSPLQTRVCASTVCRHIQFFAKDFLSYSSISVRSSQRFSKLDIKMPVGREGSLTSCSSHLASTYINYQEWLVNSCDIGTASSYLLAFRCVLN